jgi:hypothetical protein
VALVLSDNGENGGAASGLLTPEERVRVLGALQEVEAAERVDARAHWAHLARAVPDALWFAGAEEGEIHASLVDELQRAGVKLLFPGATGGCTTPALMERMKGEPCDR